MLNESLRRGPFARTIGAKFPSGECGQCAWRSWRAGKGRCVKRNERRRGEAGQSVHCERTPARGTARPACATNVG